MLEEECDYVVKPESVIRLLCAYQSSFCHLSFRFSVTMDLHSSIKAKRHLPKNISSSHHNANDRFRLKDLFVQVTTPNT